MSEPIAATKRQTRRIVDRLTGRNDQPALPANTIEAKAAEVRNDQIERSIHELNVLIGTLSTSIADQQQAQAALIEQLDRRLRDLERTP